MRRWVRIASSVLIPPAQILEYASLPALIPRLNIGILLVLREAGTLEAIPTQCQITVEYSAINDMILASLD
jgi:hypothetical protein